MSANKMKIVNRVTIGIESNGKFLILRRTGKTVDTLKQVSAHPKLWEFPGGVIKEK